MFAHAEGTGLTLGGELSGAATSEVSRAEHDNCSFVVLPWNCIFDEGIDELPQLLTEVKPAGTNSSGASFPAVVVILNQYLDWFGAPSPGCPFQRRSGLFPFCRLSWLSAAWRVCPLARPRRLAYSLFRFDICRGRGGQDHREAKKRADAHRWAPGLQNGAPSPFQVSSAPPSPDVIGLCPHHRRRR
jgi:hypothetical protein